MRGKGKWIAAFIGVAVVLCSVVFLIGVGGLRLGRGELPSVQIITPHHGDEVATGFTVPVQAQATAQRTKITRLQLWVDGRLIAGVPGMARRLSGSWRWSPSAPGDHTLLVQAFNEQGGVGQASVRVRAVETTDQDGDGVPREEDVCPRQAGPADNRGCPVVETGDKDGDGVPDTGDNCPDEPGPAENQGCSLIPDQDSDSVPDEQDNCPDQAGPAENQGCPIIADQDNDGVPDEQDNCPDQAGPAENQGCPIITAEDQDGDGVPDDQDNCSDQVGPAENQGCPVVADQDGDGITDEDDNCPEQAGPADNQGCPVIEDEDGDGDGVLDAEDDCPDQPGPADNQGCPLPPPSQDRDGDSILDSDDFCPNEAGFPENQGCPLVGPGDEDGDGIPDDEEEVYCRYAAGILPLGCPTDEAALVYDRDGDGSPDWYDTCPDEAGPGGACPIPSGEDADGDGVVNDEDDCPGQPGPEWNSGCPVPSDGDGDGIPAGQDLCPDVPGPSANRGCPMFADRDRDGDGVVNEEDDCPTLSGSPGNDGCPTWVGRPGPGGIGGRGICETMPIICGLGVLTDQDGDGVPAIQDNCPSEAGPAWNRGCPLTREDTRELWERQAELQASRLCTLAPVLCAAPPEDLGEEVEVEVELGERLYTDTGWDSLWCYVQVEGLGFLRLPPEAGSLEQISPTVWNVGSQRSLTITIRERELLTMRMFCEAWSNSLLEVRELGEVNRQHGYDDWRGTLFDVWSEGADNSFEINYRMCLGSC